MLHSFLLIGQSNMAGRGFPAEAMPVDLSRIRLLRNGLWTGAFRPFSADRGFAGVSLAESFAEAYATERNVEVGVVACADGGTRLAQWMPGQPLYENAVFQTKLAMRSSQLAGILWHQGEGDMAPQLWPQYEENFRIFLHALRSELGAQDVPVLIGGLGDFLAECPLIPLENRPNYAVLNAVFERLAATEPQVGYVPAAGLGANPDQLHFSAAALHAFGLRYYDVYKEMKPVLPVNADTAGAQRTALEQL